MGEVIKVNINIPMFYTKISIVIGESDKPFRGAEDIFSGFYIARCAFNSVDGNKYILIHSKTFAMSVIAHEAVHAASYILQSIGHKADFNNDELQAYFVQHILEAVEKKLYD